MSGPLIKAFVGVLLLATLQCRFVSPIAEEPAATAAGMLATTVELTTAELATAELTTPVSAIQQPAPSATSTPEPSATQQPTSTAVPTPTIAPTPAPSETPLPHALYCVRPPEDYTRLEVGQHTLNARTLAMLEVAQEIYGGPGDIMRITQGSYRDVLATSFGTHAGGGAVDISIRDPRQESVFLWDEAEAMVTALRYAGFAAWYRQAGDLGEGSAAHIHAIAVGDAELSEVAQEQVSGAGGYFAGTDGLIAPYGPNTDRHGGAVLCPWMQ